MLKEIFHQKDLRTTFEEFGVSSQQFEGNEMPEMLTKPRNDKGEEFQQVRKLVFLSYEHQRYNA